jgi:hypothetical protein
MSVKCKATEKSMSLYIQVAHGVAEEIENCRVIKRCWHSSTYGDWEQREAGTELVWGVREDHVPEN